jgi:hypothetical protein
MRLGRRRKLTRVLGSFIRHAAQDPVLHPGTAPRLRRSSGHHLDRSSGPRPACSKRLLGASSSWHVSSDSLTHPATTPRLWHSSGHHLSRSRGTRPACFKGRFEASWLRYVSNNSLTRPPYGPNSWPAWRYDEHNDGKSGTALNHALPKTTTGSHAKTAEVTSQPARGRHTTSERPGRPRIDSRGRVRLLGPPGGRDRPAGRIPPSEVVPATAPSRGAAEAPRTAW